MLKELKTILMDYALLGLGFGLAAAVFGKNESWPEKIKNITASVTLSLIVGSALKGMEINDFMIFAAIGGTCPFARDIFGGAGNLIRIISARPLESIKQVISLWREH